MKKPVMFVVLGVVLTIGVGYSVYDYKTWRYEELKNYGHGPGDTQPKIQLPELVQLYRNEVVRIRLRVPAGWVIQENPKFQVLNPKSPPVLANLLVPEKREEVAKFGDRMTVEILKTKINLPDFVRKEAGDNDDWLYVNGGRVGFTVVTYPDKSVAYSAGDYTYIVTWNGVDDGTFVEILKTIVAI